MIGLPAGTQVWLIAGHTDMRKGFDGLAAHVQYQIDKDPFSGQIFVFRGRRGDRIKVLWWGDQGLCLFYKLQVPRMVATAAQHSTASWERPNSTASILRSI